MNHRPLFMALDSGLHEMELPGDELECSVPVFQSHPSSTRTHLHHLLWERHGSPGACENTGPLPPVPSTPHLLSRFCFRRSRIGPKKLAFLERSQVMLRLLDQGSPSETHSSEELAHRCLTWSGEAEDTCALRDPSRLPVLVEIVSSAEASDKTLTYSEPQFPTWKLI